MIGQPGSVGQRLAHALRLGHRCDQCEGAIRLLLLTLLAVGLASGQQTAHAIAQWVVLHADALRAALPDLLRLPSESTLLRALRQIDHQMLEQAVAQLNSPQTTAEERADLLRTPAGTLLQAQP